MIWRKCHEIHLCLKTSHLVPIFNAIVVVGDVHPSESAQNKAVQWDFCEGFPTGTSLEC